MNSSGLWQDIKANPLILIAVIVLHFVLILLLGINLTSSEVPKYSAPAKETIKAVVVDADKIEAEAKKREQENEKKKQQALAQQNKLKQDTEKARKQREAEKQRQAELKKKQAAEKTKLATIKKKKEAERRAAENKRVEAEKQKELAEKKKAAELAEKRRLEEAAELKRKQQAEAELKRRQEEAAELQQKLEEEERREAEALQQAQRNEMLNSLRAQYVKLIEQKVERNWLRPVTSTTEMSCEVIVTQTPLGDVLSVRLQQCTNDLAFQRSIERAVRKASPLPSPPDPEVFDREIHFTFRPGS